MAAQERAIVVSGLDVVRRTLLKHLADMRDGDVIGLSIFEVAERRDVRELSGPHVACHRVHQDSRARLS